MRTMGTEKVKSILRNCKSYEEICCVWDDIKNNPNAFILSHERAIQIYRNKLVDNSEWLFSLFKKHGHCNSSAVDMILPRDQFENLPIKNIYG